MYTQEEKNIFFYVYANTHYFSSNFSNLDISFFLGYLYNFIQCAHIGEQYQLHFRLEGLIIRVFIQVPCIASKNRLLKCDPEIHSSSAYPPDILL